MYYIIIFVALWCNISHSNTLHIDKNHITITPQFRGDVINVYGIHPESGSVIAILKGEKETYYIQKKQRKFGVWVKGEKRKFTDVYRYYNILAEKPLDVTNISHLLQPFEIGIENINTYNTTVAETIATFEHKNALFANKIHNNLYKENYYAKITKPDNLLYLKFQIPRNLPEGKYVITIYIINEGDIVKIINMPVYVSYSNLLNFITYSAKNQKMLYFILSIMSSIGIALISYILLGKKYMLIFKIIQKIPQKILEQNHTIEVTKPQEIVKRKRGRPKKNIQNI